MLRLWTLWVKKYFNKNALTAPTDILFPNIANLAGEWFYLLCSHIDASIAEISVGNTCCINLLKGFATEIENFFSSPQTYQMHKSGYLINVSNVKKISWDQIFKRRSRTETMDWFKCFFCREIITLQMCCYLWLVVCPSDEDTGKYEGNFGCPELFSMRVISPQSLLRLAFTHKQHRRSRAIYLIACNGTDDANLTHVAIGGKTPKNI